MKFKRFKEIKEFILPGGKLPHRSIYLLGLTGLAVSLPLSVFTTSISEIVLAVNWLIERKFGEKWEYFKIRKSLWFILSIYIVHILGLLHTSNFLYAFHDLRIKLPFLILALVIGTSPSVERIHLKWILIVFAGAVTVASLISASILFRIIPYSFNNVHEISLFVSHIRFSLLINVAVFALIYIVITDEFRLKIWEYLVYTIALFWLVIFLYLLQSLTGILAFLITGFVLFWIYIWKVKYLIVRWFLIVTVIAITSLILLFLTSAIERYYTKDNIDSGNLERYTVNGNPYFHDTENKQIENGHYVWLYFCEEELEREWNMISKIDYRGRNNLGGEIKYTLMRYLTSKGLRKDSVGISRLRAEDIRLIENGIANYIYGKKTSIYPKIYEVIWQIDMFVKGGNPSGHSVTQRILYLQAGIEIIKQNSWFGVGTGDVGDAFQKYYEESKSELEDRWRLRAHNQYITFVLTFGVFGFLWIMFSYIYPVSLEKKWEDYFFIMFFIIGFLSMLNEDTLETQTGISFFSLFYTLFLLGVKNRETGSGSESG